MASSYQPESKHRHPMNDVGPPARSEENKQFDQDRDTMKPENGEKLQKQLPDDATSPNIDLHAPDTRSDVPVPPAEIKGGVRK